MQSARISIRPGASPMANRVAIESTDWPMLHHCTCVCRWWAYSFQWVKKKVNINLDWLNIYNHGAEHTLSAFTIILVQYCKMARFVNGTSIRWRPTLFDDSTGIQWPTTVGSSDRIFAIKSNVWIWKYKNVNNGEQFEFELHFSQLFAWLSNLHWNSAFAAPYSNSACSYQYYLRSCPLGLPALPPVVPHRMPDQLKTDWPTWNRATFATAPGILFARIHRHEAIASTVRLSRNKWAHLCCMADWP